jgi:SagB-type dehydrogenase family enzyme
MKKEALSILLLVIMLFAVNTTCATERDQIPIDENAEIIFLPAPSLDGTVSVERALAGRRSHRNFKEMALTKQQLSQILWAAYGITMPLPHPQFRGGLRTTPSAGATFPLEIYVVIGNVEGIEPGVFKYICAENKIVRTINRDVRAELAVAGLNQLMLREAPITIVFAAIYERSSRVYGARGRERYVYMEIGHAGQNVYLQAEAMGLGTCAIAAFHDDRVKALLELPDNVEPLYLMPVGYIYRD